MKRERKGKKGKRVEEKSVPIFKYKINLSRKDVLK